MSKQQTSLLSFFGGGGSRTNSNAPTSAATAAAAAAAAASTCTAHTLASKANAPPSSKAKNAASNKSGRKSMQKRGGRGSKNTSAPNSSKSTKRRQSQNTTSRATAVVATAATSSTCSSGSDKVPETSSAKHKKRRTSADSSEGTKTPPSKSAPDFASFAFSSDASNDNDVVDKPSASRTPSTAASTPPSLSPDDDDAKRSGELGAIDLPLVQSPLVDVGTVSSGDGKANADNDLSAAPVVDDDADSSSDEDVEDPSNNSDDDNGEDNDSIDSNQSKNINTTGGNKSGGGEHQLSEYELLRLRNIERNNRRLAALGLGGAWSSNEGGNNAKKKQRKKVKGDTTKVKTPALPTRRSTRNRQSVLDAHASDEKLAGANSAGATTFVEVHKQAFVEEEPEIFTVSPMLDYAMASPTETSEANTDGAYFDKWSTSTSPEDITSLNPIGKRLAPPNGLGAIYTLQFYPKEWIPSARPNDRDWIVGAGKAGIISLWDCCWRSSNDKNDDQDNMIDPVLSWKAHSGRWVADVRFLPGGNGADTTSTSPPSRLLSAANDGCICLWDLTSVSATSGAPKLLSRTGKDIHRSGIFALDVSIGEPTNICTGSKDKTVAVSTLDGIAGGSYAPVWVSDYHSAKVGAVALKGCNSSLLASASDDSSIAVHDFRASGKGQVVAELIDIHKRPHSVVWNKLSENELMTGGLDDEIKVFDIRSLGSPLLSYHGHTPSNLQKYKRIHHPVFYNPCNKTSSAEQFVLSGGERSHSLSMFRNSDEEKNKVPVYSRGKLPSDCGDAGCLAVQGERVAAAVDGGEVLLLEPQVKS